MSASTDTWAAGSDIFEAHGGALDVGGECGKPAPDPNAHQLAGLVVEGNAAPNRERRVLYGAAPAARLG